MKIRINYIPEVEYSFRDLLKAIGILILILLLNYRFYTTFPYLVKGFRQWVECNCQNLSALRDFMPGWKQITEHIISVLELMDDILVLILILLILSSMIKKRMCHEKESCHLVSVEYDIGAKILKLLPRKRE